MRILITGGSGLLGWNLSKIASCNHQVIISYFKHPVELPDLCSVLLNIINKSEVKKLIKFYRPEVIIHTAALTNVDFCEENKEITKKTNVNGTRNIAEAVEEINGKLIFCSTDLVFDGKKGNYREEDEVNPLNYYAETKVKGEEIIRKICSNYVIARISIIYGWSNNINKGFTDNLLENLKSKKKVFLFQDQFRSPIYAVNLSEALLEIAKRDITGIIHLGGKERISRYEFGRKFARKFHLDTELIIEGSFMEHDLIGTRPKDSSLDISKAKAILKTRFIDINEGLNCMKETLSH